MKYPSYKIGDAIKTNNTDLEITDIKRVKTRFIISINVINVVLIVVNIILKKNSVKSIGLKK